MTIVIESAAAAATAAVRKRKRHPRRGRGRRRRRGDSEINLTALITHHHHHHPQVETMMTRMQMFDGVSLLGKELRCILIRQKRIWYAIGHVKIY